MSARTPFSIRRYDPADAPSWLRCRALSFLDTCYYDDVRASRPDGPALQLVAASDGEVLGILDISIDPDAEPGLATIDTIAVHPEHRRRGIAAALLEAALELVPESVTTLDAWTREDEEAHAWYRAFGFEESEHYLHVYKRWDEPADGFVSPEPLSRPVIAFCHAAIEHEAEMRARYARVYVCRRFHRSARACFPARRMTQEPVGQDRAAWVDRRGSRTVAP